MIANPAEKIHPWPGAKLFHIGPATPEAGGASQKYQVAHRGRSHPDYSLIAPEIHTVFHAVISR